jgi:hypothetical protein
MYVSLLVNPIYLPERSFVERIGQFQQMFAIEKKEIPCDHQAKQTLREPKNFYKGKTPHQRFACQSSQARSTNDPVVMFGDAFPAKKLFTFRAPRHGFAHHMVKTALIGK